MKNTDNFWQNWHYWIFIVYTALICILGAVAITFYLTTHQLI
jgi:hypothetical protein